MRDGVRLALDWGDARIGVAASDPAGILASPVTTLTASQAPVEAVLRLVAEYEPIEVLVGLPRNMDGSSGPAAAKARRVAGELADRLDVPVRLVDERLTTVQASRALRASGRNAKKQRSRIDQAAAVEILRGALDGERATGEPVGELV